MIYKNSWVEISEPALIHNLAQFRKLIGTKVKLMVPVKANAYGHGLVETTKVLVKDGVDFFGVNSLAEAQILRSHKILKPILILGYVKLDELSDLVKLKDVALVVYNLATIKKLGQLKKSIKVHLKLETGTGRQGIDPADILDFINSIKKFSHIKIEGLYTHFANIEDTLDHSFAFKQLEIFNNTIYLLDEHKIKIPLKHTACSAATILYKQTHFDLVRPGISTYGLWSSNETRLTAEKHRKLLTLKQVLSWKTFIAQIKTIKKDMPIGYGCSERLNRDSKIAILPVGYWDGLDRGYSNIGNVLIKGLRAKILGRICMNMCMVDVTDIDDIKVEDEVVLIGRQAPQQGSGRGIEEITVDEMANKLNTINYEVVTRINPLLPRKIIK